MSGWKIQGTGSCLPETAVGNDVFCAAMDTSNEWIVTRTGIERRHFLKERRLLDIAVSAGGRALEDAGVSAGALDLILCATLQADDVTPSLACLVQRELGARCPAFDVNAACSGFIYALDIALAYFQSGKVERVLIVCAEQMSKFLDWSDRSTCVLFGDGAGAVVLTRGDAVRELKIGAQGGREHLHIQAPALRQPFEALSPPGFVRMNGQEIFKFAVTAGLRESRLAARQAGLSLDDIDWFLLHQANGRIIEAVRNGLCQPAEKFPANFMSCGNTSSASIPLLLDELNRAGRLKKGDRLLLMAFGAGLTTGVCILEWQPRGAGDSQSG